MCIAYKMPLQRKKYFRLLKWNKNWNFIVEKQDMTGDITNLFPFIQGSLKWPISEFFPANVSLWNQCKYNITFNIFSCRILIISYKMLMITGIFNEKQINYHLTTSGLQKRPQMAIMSKIETTSIVPLKLTSRINLGRRGAPAPHKPPLPHSLERAIQTNKDPQLPQERPITPQPDKRQKARRMGAPRSGWTQPTSPTRITQKGLRNITP